MWKINLRSVCFVLFALNRVKECVYWDNLSVHAVNNAHSHKEVFFSWPTRGWLVCVYQVL